MERPEYGAMGIHCHEPKVAAEREGLYCFPGGRLLWCGLVNETTGETTDLTSQVGMVRRHWIKLDPWDSRYYYPATPLYSCPRAWTQDPEFAVEVKQIPAGARLLAFVAAPEPSDSWGTCPDRLNPDVTQLFLRMTHERYAAAVGERFGKQIRAIYSDESELSSQFPWTRDMFSDFKKQFGYDLPPRLWQLFAKTTNAQSALTRLHYRQWCGRRFRRAWFEPVSQWCHAHRLALVGHVSPEEDPVNQVCCVGNLFPVFSYFALPGHDLIIPAVGDHRHPLLNLGVLSATSASQQLGRAGVLSESLACSGLDFTAEQAGRILRWQLMMGVTTPVVAEAYNSVEGLRLIEVPPDFGPASSRWQGMLKLGRELAQLQPIVSDAEQIAPAAVVWPIRSFAAQPPTDFRADSPLRNELVHVVQLCLDRQVGVHLLDEADLWRSQTVDRQLRLGKAAYSHIVLAGCSVLHEHTVAKLREAAQAGVTVLRVGQGPQWQETQVSVEPLRLDWCAGGNAAEVVGRLPRLMDLGPDGTDIRCTIWRHGDQCTRLLMNLRKKPVDVIIDGKQVELAPGKIHPPIVETRK